ncbi:MAG TPA: LacI family DNA-binding transcriptional regulator [Fimbriimonas sp.]
MASIRDVAKASGVSIATVSHVLNGRSTKVSDETRDRVLAAVRELRYRPTALEDRQRAILTKNIGFLTSDLATSPITRNAYFGLILNSVLETAALRGYSTTIFVERMWDDIGHAIRRSYDGRCDGVLLLAPSVDSDALRTLWERGTPLVSIGTTVNLPGVSLVDIDNETAAATLTRYLQNLGHRRIAFVGGSVVGTSALERARGYVGAMIEAGATDEEVCVVNTRGISDDANGVATSVEAHRPARHAHRYYDVVGLGQAVARFVVESAMPDVTAFVCWNDGVAREVIAGLKRKGVRVPDDVSIVSFDDSADATSERPCLTTMRQPFHQIGKTAVGVLLDRILDPGQPAQAVRYMPEMIIRESAIPVKEQVS